MQVFIDYLQNYIELTKEEASLVSSNIKSRNYLKGQYIVQAGDVCRYQTFIVSGITRTFYLDDNGNEHIITFGIENWWNGDMMSFINQSPADFNIQCLENTQVIQIAYHNIENLFLKVPKMERFFRIIIQSAYANTQKRIIRNYSMNAKERYHLFCEEYPQIVQRVPQYMIASYLGITKEFLSQIRNQSKS